MPSSTKLFCPKCGIVDKTLTPIEDGEPMQCPGCLDFTVETIEDEVETKSKKVRVFKGSVQLEDYLRE